MVPVKMQDKSLAYLKTKIGCYALTPPMRGDYGITPKNMLVRLDEDEIREHAGEFIDTEVDCAVTKTGARFCVFKGPNFQIEAMEMILPSWKYSIMLREKREPTLQEAREKYRNAFLVIACKPKEFCEEKEHL